MTEAQTSTRALIDIEAELGAFNYNQHTLRLAPPLIITREQVDFALRTIEQVLRAG